MTYFSQYKFNLQIINLSRFSQFSFINMTIKRSGVLFLWFILLWSNYVVGEEENISHMINIPYVDSAGTKINYKNNPNAKNYKICRSMMKDLEHGGKNITVIQPKIVNKTLDKDIFRKHLPDCSLDKFITTAESEVHKAENTKGEMQSYWTTSGKYYRSNYYAIYDTSPIVLYIGRGKEVNNGEVSEKYNGPGRFKLIQKNGCRTIDSFSDGWVQGSNTPKSLSRVVNYKDNLYLFKYRPRSTMVAVKKVGMKKFELMCSFHKEYNNKGEIK